MSQRAKLIGALRNNPKDVRFDDACKIAEWLGFESRSRATSHRVYARPGEDNGLNFQNNDGRIPVYQARQLIEIVDKYEGEL